MQIANMEFETVEIRMDGVFDVEAAQSVVRALEKAPTERDVRVDLTHVREFHDFAVAVLAQALAKRRENVTVRGLRQHHMRLLGYLGLAQKAEPMETGESAMA